MDFEYLSLCLFWNWLIYLMPIYCCFYVSWFCFTNWKQIKGMKTCCLSNVKQTMHQHFYTSCYSLHLCFAVSALSDDFTIKKGDSFYCIYRYVTNYVLLCCIWSDVLWSLLVKWFYSESFQIMTKDKAVTKSLSAILFIWVILAHCTKNRKFREYIVSKCWAICN